MLAAIGLPDVLLLWSRPPYCPPKKSFSKGVFALKNTYFSFVLLFEKFLLKSPPFLAHGSGNPNHSNSLFQI